MARTIVVGAGISGLAVAWRLQELVMRSLMSVTDGYFLVAKFLGSGMLGYRGGSDFLARALAVRLDASS